MNTASLWERYKKYLCAAPSIGLTLDVSRMNFADDYFDRMEPMLQNAYRAMDDLEAGAIANPDENRMVGHYWLRAPQLAPSPDITQEIRDTLAAVKRFASGVHAGRIKPQKRKIFTRVLSIGIGGSALGPQFVAHALGTPTDKMKVHFLDNTDPDGFDRVFAEIGDQLAQTLTLIISKSGGTTETRNGMLEAEARYVKAGLNFEKHAVAVTGVGSKLDKIAEKGNWLKRFPMWDWIGGRTSELSAVGLLPAALQGLPIEEMLKGAELCDEATRAKETRKNPSALLALCWYHATNGTGRKEKDQSGKVVNQGMAVYGNKGTTDQHAYVQQLRDGVNNFFATFIEVLNDKGGRSIPVEPGITSGDYLSAFLQGTRNALYDNGRESITITIERLDARTLGALIALYERAVGLYAALINVNAYHQPGVEAGKKMAGAIISLQAKALAYLRAARGTSFTAEQVAAGIAAPDQVESVFKILEHASANADHRLKKNPAANITGSTYAALR
jgi:glucose-6-phosphate isomerase